MVGKVKDVQKVWLSAREAKAYLGCSDELLQTLRDRAEVKWAKYGAKSIWYDLSSLDRFIQRNLVVR